MELKTTANRQGRPTHSMAVYNPIHLVFRCITCLSFYCVFLFVVAWLWFQGMGFLSWVSAVVELPVMPPSVIPARIPGNS